MSEWTNVRIIYDIEKALPSKFHSLDVYTWISIPIQTLFESAIHDFDYPDIQKLGSERGCIMKLIPVVGASFPYPYEKEGFYSCLQVHDRAFLILVGNLRDVNRKEFIQKLNEFRAHLRKFGISVTDGTVSII